MNQEKISDFIKEVRTKSHLSQEKFGEKYGVTYQAVSKWENGKNLPDIVILKEICKDYQKDINELLENPTSIKKSNKKILLFGILFLVLLGILISFLFRRHEFQLKTLKTTCDAFELSGSIAYDDSKTSIYISNITYCGEPNPTKYKKLECLFYEINEKTKKEIDNNVYEGEPITLEDFLKQVNFKVDHYSKSCGMVKEGALKLEIKAVDENDTTTMYEIPLSFGENCS